MTNKIMIIWSIFCLTVVFEKSEEQVMWEDIEKGDILAWAEHITGQDVNDMNDWDEFKSVAVIHGNSAKECGDTRLDDEIWVIVDRTIDGNDYTFVEQFQPLDWGDDSDYCWFVDAGIGDANSLGKAAVAEIPEQPPAPYRDEAYVVANNTSIIWFDIEWNVLSYDDYGVILSVACDDVVVDDDGNVIVGYGTSASNGPIFSLFDTDLTETVDYLSPTVNASDWGYGDACLGVHFSTDKTHLFVRTDTIRAIWKFDLSTGLDEWKVQTTWGGGIDVDSSDNVYCYKDGYVYRYDTDGNYVSRVSGSCFQRIVYDEDDERVYGAGYSIISPFPLRYRQVRAKNWDGTNDCSFSIDENDADQGTGLLKIGEYVFVTGPRNQTGVGGAWASVWKLDEDLNLVASYDSDYGYGSHGLFLDHDDNLAIIHGDRASEDLNAGIWILDTDLNYISDHQCNTDVTVLAALSGAKIPYLDDGTPGVPGVPGVEPNNVPDYDHLEGIEVCVYADGRPIGNYDVTTDANGTTVIDIEDEYDVVIAGINYFSIYESFPLILGDERAGSFGYIHDIKDLKIDFYESMGCHVGVSIDDSVNWTFSFDDFATAIDPVTEIKEAPFVWGLNREPKVYLWEWEPIPMTLRNIRPKVGVTME